MRITRVWAITALACAALFTGAGTSAADSPSPDPSESSESGENTEGPTQAGTGFRDAPAVPPGTPSTVGASSGDYLYWAFSLDAGQRPTLKAKVTLPEPAARHGESTWRIDVYDGLRRRQPCVYGTQSRATAQDAASAELSCTLRTIHSLADPWSDHPLPGTYYLRLTVAEAPEKDLGLPVRARVEAVTKDAGGAHAVDGALSTPLVAGASADDGQDEGNGNGDGTGDGDGQDDAGPGTDAARKTAASAAEPEDGWSSGWWSDRWIWTVGGGLLAALAALGGYSLARGPGRASRMPPRG